MTTADVNRTHRNRRPWWIAGAVSVLLAALGVRLWIYEEPVKRLQLEIPTEAVFRYFRVYFSESENEVISGSVDIQPDAARTMINLINRSALYEPESEWTLEFDWPPIYRSQRLPQDDMEFQILDVVPSGSRNRSTTICFLNESLVVAPGGVYEVLEENRGELRHLLDSLNAQCQAAYEEHADGEHNQDEASYQRGAESPSTRHHPERHSTWVSPHCAVPANVAPACQ